MTTIRRSLLSKILGEMVRAAYLDRGSIQAHDFNKGASVKLYITSEREFHFKVWRSGAYPGDVEWETFIRFLPDGCRPEHAPEPERKESGGVCAFVAQWPLITPKFGES